MKIMQFPSSGYITAWKKTIEWLFEQKCKQIIKHSSENQQWGTIQNGIWMLDSHSETCTRVCLWARLLLKRRHSEMSFVLKLVTLETTALSLMINLSFQCWEITCLKNVVLEITKRDLYLNEYSAVEQCWSDIKCVGCKSHFRPNYNIHS